MAPCICSAGADMAGHDGITHPQTVQALPSAPAQLTIFNNPDVSIPADEAGRRRLWDLSKARISHNLDVADKNHETNFLTHIQIGWDAARMQLVGHGLLSGYASFDDYLRKKWGTNRAAQIIKYKDAVLAFGLDRMTTAEALRAGIERLARAAKGGDELVWEVLFELAGGAGDRGPAGRGAGAADPGGGEEGGRGGEAGQEGGGLRT